MTGQTLTIGLVTGFLVVASATLVLDKVGDYLYQRGVVKPFYVLGRRLHHRTVVKLVPASYAVVATMVYFHYVRVLWSSFWPGVEITLCLAGACLLVDFTLDSLSSKEKRRALLHHEWVYFVVPAYAFTHMIALAYVIP